MQGFLTASRMSFRNKVMELLSDGFHPRKEDHIKNGILEASLNDRISDPTVTAGLQLVERLMVSGFKLPVLLIMDHLGTLSGLEGARAVVAAQMMELPVAREVLEECGADILGTDCKGNNLLHSAVLSKDMQLIKYLTKNVKLLLNVPNGRMLVPMGLAVQMGDKWCVRALLDAGTALTESVLFTTVYCSAVVSLQWMVAELKKRPRMQVNGILVSAFFRAVELNRIECVKILLAAGGNVTLTDEEGNNPLHICAMKGYNETLSALLRSRWVMVNQKNRTGFTPLILAVMHEHPACVRILLDAGADPNEAAEDGIYSYLVCQRSFSSSVFRLRAPLSPKGIESLSPLHFACIYREFDSMKMLLAHGAKVNENSNWCGTPFHVTVLNNEWKFSKELLKYGANINGQNSADETALHVAVAENKLQEVKMLLKQKANPNMRDMDGNTALHIAVSNATQIPSVPQDYEPLEEAMLWKACLDQLQGRKPSMPKMSSRYKKQKQTDLLPGRSLAMVYTLLEHNADPNIRDARGRTAKRLALDLGNSECASAFH